MIKKSNLKADSAKEVAKAITKATPGIEAKIIESIIIRAAKHNDATKPTKSTKEIVRIITKMVVGMKTDKKKTTK